MLCEGKHYFTKAEFIQPKPPKLSSEGGGGYMVHLISLTPVIGLDQYCVLFRILKDIMGR